MKHSFVSKTEKLTPVKLTLTAIQLYKTAAVAALSHLSHFKHKDD